MNEEIVMNPIFLVKVPVANLRRAPTAPLPLSYKKDPDQESQLLYNETVRLIDQDNGWAFVEAQEQLHKGTSGYRGWIAMEDLIPSDELMSPDVFVTSFWSDLEGKQPMRVSFGTGFKSLGQSDLMTEVLLSGGGKGKVRTEDLTPEAMTVQAEKFLEVPYLWGGRSAFDANHSELTGVDCSGLVSLLFRVRGIHFPRNAVDQWRCCDRIACDELEEGDLVFSSSKGRVENIDHVMLYCGGGDIIEASMSAGKVHKIPLKEKRRRFLKDEFFFGRYGGGR